MLIFRGGFLTRFMDKDLLEDCQAVTCGCGALYALRKIELFRKGTTVRLQDNLDL